ncbi:MAG: hypothetical protein Q9217_006521 [Psora testacea]
MADVEQQAPMIPQAREKSEQKKLLEQTLDDLLERYLLLLDGYQTLQAELNSHLASVSDIQRPLGSRGTVLTSIASSSPNFCVLDTLPSSSSVVDAETGSQHPSDPLQWFGILVPPALKACQRDFKAVVSCAPMIASVTKEMKDVEIEVRRTRKRLSKQS